MSVDVNEVAGFIDDQTNIAYLLSLRENIADRLNTLGGGTAEFVESLGRLNHDTALQTLMTTELDSLANGALVVSSVVNTGNLENGIYDNSDALDSVGDIELAVTYGSAPAAGTKVAELYLLPTIDGTNFATVDANNQPQLALLVATFESRLPSTTVTEYLHAPGIALPPGSFKFVIKNTSGQAFSTSSVAKTLRMRAYKR